MSKSDTFSVYTLKFPDGMYYVGCTKQLKARMRSHKFAAFHGGSRPVQKALNKYGWDLVEKSVLSLDLQENAAYELEVASILKLNSRDNGYNRAIGGKVNRGYNVPSWNKGMKMSERHRQALIDAKAGKDCRENSRTNATRCPVVAVNVNNGETHQFLNATVCSQWLGVHYSTVYAHISRLGKTINKEWQVRRLDIKGETL